MVYKLVVSHLASKEATDATDYYNSIGEDLADRFIDELSATYQTLTLQPQFYSFISTSRKNSLRNIKLKSFS